MEKNSLSTSEILNGGFNLGLKNLMPIIVNYILFVLTFWIPYLNVGTFIAMVSGIPLKMSRGEEISYTEIFEADYRKNFGEYFILRVLTVLGIYFGMIFLIIPGIILGFVWFISDLIFLDEKPNLLDALRRSSDFMEGKKTNVFLASLLFIVIILVAYLIGSFLMESIPFLGALVLFLTILFVTPFAYGIKAYVYQHYSNK